MVTNMLLKDKMQKHVKMAIRLVGCAVLGYVCSRIEAASPPMGIVLLVTALGFMAYKAGKASSSKEYDRLLDGKDEYIEELEIALEEDTRVIDQGVDEAEILNGEIMKLENDKIQLQMNLEVLRDASKENSSLKEENVELMLGLSDALDTIKEMNDTPKYFDLKSLLSMYKPVSPANDVKSKDFLDEITTERTKANPKFPSMVAKVAKKRAVAKKTASKKSVKKA